MTLHSRDNGELEFGRILAFSDGVFAIAITLLVLSINVPTVPESSTALPLPEELVAARSQLVAYFISFAVVGLYWVHHHRLLAELRGFDGRLMALNLFVLCFIALLPVPTEILGDYADQPWGVWPYAVCMAMVSLGMAAIFHHARTHDLLRAPPATPAALRARNLRNTAPVVVFLASVPVAFLSPLLAARHVHVGPARGDPARDPRRRLTS